MANHSEKKAKKAQQSSNKIYMLFIFIATGIYLIIHLYQYFIKKREDIFTKRDIFGFIILSTINYVVYKLLNVFDSNSYFYSYLFDFLGLNCLIEILINFSKKFWYLYLIYPSFFIIKGCQGLYGYVSNIGKTDEFGGIYDEGDTTGKYKGSGHQAKQVKEKKQKVKYVKH